MAIGLFIGARDGLFIEASPGYPRELAVATMSRVEREICRMTGASIAAFTKARAKRLAGVDPVSGKAVTVAPEQPGLRPYPPEEDDGDEDPADSSAPDWQLRTAPMRVKFPATITERRPDGRATRRKAAQ